MFNINRRLHGEKVVYISSTYALKPGSRRTKLDSMLIYLEYLVVQYNKESDPVIIEKNFTFRPPFELAHTNKTFRYKIDYDKLLDSPQFSECAEEIFNDLADSFVCGYDVISDFLYPLHATCRYYNIKPVVFKGILDIKKIQAHTRNMYSKIKLTLKHIYNDYFKFQWERTYETLKDKPGMYAKLYRLIFEAQVERFNNVQYRDIYWFNKVSDKHANKIDPDGLFCFSLRKEPIIQVGRYAGTLMKDVPAEYYETLNRPVFQDETLRVIRDAMEGIYPVYSDYRA